MSHEENLKKLKIRRGQIKAQCTRALNTVTSHTAHDMPVAQLLERKAKIETWSQFDKVQAEIESLQHSAEFLDVHESDRADYEEMYYVIAKFQNLITDRNSVSLPEDEAHPATVNRERPIVNSLKLPRIDLSSFSGTYEEWYPFHDTFHSLIHRDNSITEIQKFHYLKSSLKGEAAEVIQSLEISSNNYKEAWHILKRRYDNKRLIIQKHIKALFDLQPIVKENHTGLRHLVDGILKHLRALKAIGRPTDSWDDLIVHLITSKLDYVMNKEWENSIKDIPTV